ncbi:D-alanyl-D-alanine carboxypeptidase/D-alanyl-D-alanine endopeptidase [Nocardioides gansuensis]|uniref:D-alanyl-D-alanine carboxypeptidase/D-alanyl-D-alanine endopeptidase n=1 Tax=Nocardioides gansuensis TaxID=2138300 RepID=UPI0014031661|nr:D-alanyl-D-alanine carboxypeptidase/D-alanyl-D-alanine-endopeptidase [Nocardioides gansuensis]
MGRDARHARGAGVWTHRLPTAAVLLLLVAAAVVGQLDVRIAGLSADPLTEPEAVAPPAGLSVPEWSAPPPVATAVPPRQGGAVDPRRVEAALAAALEDKDLGKHVVAAVGSLSGQEGDWVWGGDAFTPASTTKVLTAVAALEVLGPERRFATQVVTGASRRELVLVGGGDPHLAGKPLTPEEEASAYPERADVVTLARRTAKALGRTRRPVTLVYDASLFTGPSDNPAWRADYVPDDIVSPITALWVDEGADPDGYGRSDDPAATAAADFARALAEAGVRVKGSPVPGVAPAAAPVLASVESAPLADIVERVLDVSDNEGAELLAHHVGLAVAGEGSFEGGARGVLDTLQALGVETGDDVVYDGSGLSRRNRVSPSTLLGALRVAASPAHPELRPAVSGLPVAGFTGSLTYRFDEGAPEGRGMVRAKTGTLTGVHALAGVAVDRLGTPLVFVLAADRVREGRGDEAQDALDEIAADLVTCRCSTTG